tara:strand:- start:665 stop:1174 length:510 start_codon:yes stop_codon:yes gene_type:complete
MQTTARRQLAEEIVRIFKRSDFKDLLKKTLLLYCIQMKRGYKKQPSNTARDELFEAISNKKTQASHFDVLEVIHPFRIQLKTGKKYPRTDEKTPRKKCEVVSIKEYRESAMPISYGYVAGGPISKDGSGKICPKCNSLGLHLAMGYKERYYSCVYCGFHKDVEAATYQY